MKLSGSSTQCQVGSEVGLQAVGAKCGVSFSKQIAEKHTDEENEIIIITCHGSVHRLLGFKKR